MLKLKTSKSSVPCLFKTIYRSITLEPRSNQTPSIPKKSASIILCSPLEKAIEDRVEGIGLVSCDYKIFLVKRHSKSRFLPNVYVFPGGITEQVDENKSFWKKEFCNFPDLSLRITAIRECLEESGIFLFHKNNQKLTRNGLNNERLQIYRSDISNDSNKLMDFCTKENVHPQISCLIPWQRWITPERLPWRYDATFFLTVLGKGNEFDKNAHHDEKETIDSGWFSPAEALRKSLAGEIGVPETTWYILWEMCLYSPMLEAIEKNKKNRDMNPIVPYMITDHETIMPGDFQHPTSISASTKNNKPSRHRIHRSPLTEYFDIFKIEKNT